MARENSYVTLLRSQGIFHHYWKANSSRLSKQCNPLPERTGKWPGRVGVSSLIRNLLTFGEGGSFPKIVKGEVVKGAEYTKITAVSHCLSISKRRKKKWPVPSLKLPTNTLYLWQIFKALLLLADVDSFSSFPLVVLIDKNNAVLILGGERCAFLGLGGLGF